MNIIESFFRREFAHFLVDWEAAGNINHSGIRGFGREAAIRTFLSRVLPRTIGVEAGIITDSYGNQSPEFDVVLVDSSILGTFPISSHSAIIPIEAVLATIEVKGGVGRKELSQLETQRDSLRAMIPCPPNSQRSAVGARWLEPLNFLVAARLKSGDVSQPEVETELRKLGNMCGCMFVDGSAYLVEGSSIRVVREKKDFAITFVAHLTALIHLIQDSRPKDSAYVWHSYLVKKHH